MLNSATLILTLVFLFILALIIHLTLFTKESNSTNFKMQTSSWETIKFFISACLALLFLFLAFTFFFNLLLDVDYFFMTNCFNTNVEHADYINSNMFSFEQLLVFSLITMLLISICSIFYCVAFNIEELSTFIIYTGFIFCGGCMLLISITPICIFIAYEFILIPTAIVLLMFSKTSRSKEATIFMIVWTQIGAVILLFTTTFICSFSTFGNIFITTHDMSRLQLNFIVFLIFFAFATKMPIWPFYWWLPEVHVEVSTNFSIVLSGVTIKFAFLGFMRFVEILGFCDIGWIIMIITILGIIDAGFRVDCEMDIKKIVAYQTVAEMHLLCTYMSLDYDSFIDFILFIFPGHCWISAINFIIVDLIAKRYHSRNIEHLYGILANSPRIVKFIFLTVFIFGSIPGTTIFTIEFYIQIFSTTTLFNIFVFIFFQCIIVVFSKNIWWLLFGGDLAHHKHSFGFSPTKQELYFILFLILQLVPTLFVIDFCI